jgi:hypothetical protein
MRPVYWWVTAILMALFLFAVCAALYYVGFFLGGMWQPTLVPACPVQPVCGWKWPGRWWCWQPPCPRRC